MNNGEPVVWFATSDDRGYAWRRGGQLMIVSLVPAVLIFCGSGLAGELLPAFWLSLLLAPVAGAYALAVVVADRRAAVEVRVAGGAITLVRPDGGTTTYQARDVRRFEVIRTVYSGGGTPDVARLRLHAGGRVERTRPGPDLSPELRRALTVAEVDLLVSVKHREE
ncbi:hypothetical protein [Actinoplanes aureus]|uniref:PH domain-containing protein n=1 Tax=Actinoplanes aureus TaxID=2792083 RepID=A0A931CM20_9ACTN|nr:hypothetical protein [Actinoplanes aureus]MBG0568871.1 hypothetical protein [Actinoplanes aureus]